MQLAGRLPEPLETSFGGRQVRLPPGTVELELTFRGGEEPQITELQLLAGPVALRLTETSGEGLSALVDQLHDASIRAEAHTEGDLLVKVGHGIEAIVFGGGVVTLTAVVQGPPEDPRLASALEARVGGAGIRVSHSSARWLSALAKIRIHRVSLHPDGSVQLEGGGRGLVDLAVMRGLRRASTRITDLVKQSPRFERVRAFLP
ncbi:MAG TPA: hypothetical protein ENK18_22270 [Deltaproteobacteria bacterium]|nr:hypothetical protein [Deltaproteobacteria bacterium]